MKKINQLRYAIDPGKIHRELGWRPEIQKIHPLRYCAEGTVKQ